jgi:hypothetical protein
MSRSSSDPLFDHFDSEQHRLWKQDRLLRQRVPIQHAWRGCLGIAALLTHVEQTEYPTDRHALIPNANVTWLAMRDVPRNHFPSVPAMNRREVQYVNAASAELRYGMPVLDFTQHVREACDFRFMPFGSYHRGADPFDRWTIHGCGDVLNSDELPVEFAILNRVSAAMTRFAFCAIDSRGHALRRHWASAQPKGWAKYAPALPGQWMPRAYLAFNQKHAVHVQGHAHVSGLRVEADRGISLFPAERVGRLVRDLRPVGLWWDLQPCCGYVDGQLEAAVFPPIPLADWDRLQLTLPGDVVLDARIADPRLSHVPMRCTREVPDPSMPTESFAWPAKRPFALPSSRTWNRAG